LLSREYTDALLRSSNSTINFLPSSVAWCNGVFFLLSVIKTADRNRQTPLHLAARKGMVTIANDLIRQGARLDVQDDEGKSPIFYAVEERELSMVDALLKADALVDIIDSLSISVCGFNGGSVI
jgi:ankyrin repeat protein